jgi:hypothetical protein
VKRVRRMDEIESISQKKAAVLPWNNQLAIFLGFG